MRAILATISRNPASIVADAQACKETKVSPAGFRIDYRAGNACPSQLGG